MYYVYACTTHTQYICIVDTLCTYNLVHVSRRLLPVQTNTDDHDPQFCLENFQRRNLTTPLSEETLRIIRQCPTPEFEPAPPTVRIIVI